MSGVRNSVTFRVFAVGFLILVLLIPARMVRSLVRERESRRAEVVREIAGKWGQAQTVSGPILTIPFTEHRKDEKGRKIETTKYVHVLPEELDISGEVSPEIRYRGIYEVALFNAELNLSGSFALPDFEKMGVSPRDILWSRAFLAVGISDMTGVKEDITVEAAGVKAPVSPGIETADVVGSGVSVRVPLDRRSVTVPFELAVDLNGSERLSFVPVGKLTTVDLASTWPSPSFDGAFLPGERTVRDDGFTARWKILHLNRNYPQQWIGGHQRIGDSNFGVKLFIPADAYQKTMRTVKYAIMFIGLTFMAFFVSEVMNRNRIHPLQYLLIGLALIIFYTLLLSISEHLGFGRAYLVSGAATIFLVSAYSRSVLRSGALALMVGAILLILYAYLYVLLQLEDYALLLGSIGLFVVLAIVMFATRRIDWYAVQSE